MAKTFQQLMREGTGTSSADNFIGKKPDDEEATTKKKYRAKGEQDFADMHSRNTVKSDHPVATDAQFASSAIPSSHKGFDPKHAGEMKPPRQGSSPKPFKEAFADDETELSEDVLADLRNIVKTKGAKSVKFANGKSIKVDMTTANALVQVHDNLNDKNKAKFADQLNKGPNSFMKMADFAFSVGK